MATGITVKGLDELIARLQAYPQTLNKFIKAAMNDVLLVLWENVPPYPPPPENSKYVRTHMLAKSMGSSDAGGKSGSQPDIYEVHPLGASNGYEGRFGTNLEYAPYVIDPDRQAEVHRGRWWTITTIAEKSKDKIVQVFQGLATAMKNFLEGK